jgi:cytochrome oxidase Cu insertion factor (SCO1/SenC/PrrC family)
MMKPSRVAAVVVLVGALAGTSAPAGGQEPRPARAKIDVSKLGPQVGQRVPDFSLTDQTGRVRTLRSIAGTRGTMLVFLRSADW